MVFAQAAMCRPLAGARGPLTPVNLHLGLFVALKVTYVRVHGLSGLSEGQQTRAG